MQDLNDKKGDPSLTSSRANKQSNDNEDPDSQFSYLESIKSLILVSLPHIIIILLFVVYIFVGAAILKEIESERPGQTYEPIVSSSSSSYSPTQSSSFRLQYDKEIEIAALKLADTQRSSLNKFLADSKSHYNQLDAENKKLAGSFNDMVIRSLNLTNYYKTLGSDHKGELSLKANKAKKKTGKTGEIDEIEDDLADLNETVDQRETISFISSQLNLNNKNALTSSEKSSSKKKKKSAKTSNNNNNQQINSKQVLRSIAEHLINHKLQLKVSIVDNAKGLLSSHQKSHQKIEANIQRLVADYNARLKTANDHFLSEVARLTAKFNKEASETVSYATTTSTPSSTPKPSNKQTKKWTTQNSIYFVGTLLTTIGYGDICPQSLFGKLFTMVYLIIGLPLTLLLLADLGTILTRYIKFLYLFVIILYSDGYYEQLGYQLKNKMPFLRVFSFLFFMRSSKKRTNSQRAQAKKSSTSSRSQEAGDDPEDEDNIDTNYDENENVYAQNQTGIFRSLFEVAFSCMEQADDKFNIKLSSLFGLVCVYLTIGAVVASRYADWSILDGYYFCLITLTKVGFGDLTIDNPKFMLITSFYTLFGLSLFALTMQTLQEKLRLHFISNGQKLIDELVRFLSQFGYNINTDTLNMNLASFCKGPRIIDSSLGDSSVPLTPTKVAGVSAGLSTSNLAATFANGIAASTSTPNIAGSGYMLDDDELFLSSINLNQLSRNSSYLMNNQLVRRRGRRSNLFREISELKFKNGIFDMINKCDKQTQITTLLCSKFKYDKDAVEMSSFGPQDSSDSRTKSTQSAPSSSESAKNNVASVKPNVFYQTEPSDDEPKRDSVKGSTIPEEDEVTVIKLSRLPTIVKSSPPDTPPAASKSSETNEDDSTSTTVSLSRPPRRNRFGALGSESTSSTSANESSSSRTSPISSPRTYSFKR